MNESNLAIENSILNYTPLLMIKQFKGNPILDEYSVWQYLLNQNLIETKDKNEISNLIRKSIKLTFLSFGIGLIINRYVSIINIKGKSISQLYFILRIPIRLSFFLISFKFFAFDSIISNVIKLHYYLNMKYSERFKRFNITCDPLSMNPYFFEDNITPEQREIKQLEYNKLKGRHSLLIIQSKELETSLKSNH
jgi:hypothetical protein